jgi:hypothetical protein
MHDISAVSSTTDNRFKLPFFIRAGFDAHTQNFQILKSLEQTQESKKNYKISLEIFVKMQDGSNYGKRCLLGCSIWIFFRIGNFGNCLKKILKFT